MKLVLILLLSLLLAPDAFASNAYAIREDRVQFPAGAESVVVKGRLQSDQGSNLYSMIDYRVSGRAGQTLALTLKRTHPQTYFNVSAHNTQLAMFVGSGDSTGKAFRGILPADDDYVVRVYLMRAAARRGMVSDYELTIGLTGAPLVPLPPSQDALIPGTSFHASGMIKCLPAFETKQRKCEAFVTRRGVDGTATVEVLLSSTSRRRILFVGGVPVASDSPGTLTFSRQGDVTTVKLGADEWYEIPDALVMGG